MEMILSRSKVKTWRKWWSCWLCKRINQVYTKEPEKKWLLSSRGNRSARQQSPHQYLLWHPTKRLVLWTSLYTVLPLKTWPLTHIKLHSLCWPTRSWPPNLSPLLHMVCSARSLRAHKLQLVSEPGQRHLISSSLHAMPNIPGTSNG